MATRHRALIAIGPARWIHGQPRRWRWLARLDAVWWSARHLRVTVTKLETVSNGESSDGATHPKGTNAN